MSDRWSMLAFRCDSPDYALSLLSESLPSAGLCLEFPGTRIVKILNEIGEQQDGTRNDLVRLLQARHALTFQWWWNESEDVCCGIRLASGAAFVEFFLDGLDDAQEERLLSCIRGVYDSLAEQQIALGFVVDDQGDSQLYDWYGILAGQHLVSGELPDIAVVPRKTGERLLAHSPFPVSVQEEGEQLVLRRNT